MNRNGYTVTLNGRHLVTRACAACLEGHSVCGCVLSAFDDATAIGHGCEVRRGAVLLRTVLAAKVSEVPGRMRGAIGRRAA